jgi:acetylornithine deacetylase/succinyl-diaminopimelate desuccinylase-like protein
MKPIAPIYLLILFASLNLSCAQEIKKENLVKHIETLAADELEGRGTGTSGEEQAAKYIEGRFKNLKLKPMGENNAFRQEFTFKGGMHGTGPEGKTKNVVAYLDNNADRTIIIGAHFDHLGMGDQGSSLDANPNGKIHNGADDNASGVAGVLELARYFKSNKIKENNNFLFICFSGEELGLHGSKYFTEHPTIDLDKVNYMINLDMVGRFERDKGLSVSGSGTSPVWETLLKNLSTEEMSIKTDSSGTGPSDHTSFYLKNIPVLHFFTGSHSDYHKPTDDVDKINYQGEVDVLNLIVKVINAEETQDKLAFLTTKTKSMGSARSFKVTMGVMPSYSSDVEGLKIDGVTEGKPAHKAGILTGDIIVQIGDLTIKDIQSYMEALGKFEKGQMVPVKLKRGEEIITVNLTF